MVFWLKFNVRFYLIVHFCFKVGQEAKSLTAKATTTKKSWIKPPYTISNTLSGNKSLYNILFIYIDIFGSLILTAEIYCKHSRIPTKS